MSPAPSLGFPQTQGESLPFWVPWTSSPCSSALSGMLSLAAGVRIAVQRRPHHAVALQSLAQRPTEEAGLGPHFTPLLKIQLENLLLNTVGKRK